LKINPRENGGQTLKKGWYNPLSGKYENLSTKILYDPWFGDSYTKEELRSKDKTIYTYLILLGENTILYGDLEYYRRNDPYTDYIELLDTRGEPRP
jgi:hypothetical protein